MDYFLVGGELSLILEMIINTRIVVRPCVERLTKTKIKTDIAKAVNIAHFIFCVPRELYNQNNEEKTVLMLHQTSS